VVLPSYFLLDLRNDAVLRKNKAAPKVVLKVSSPIKAKISGFLNIFLPLRRHAGFTAHSGKNLETIGCFLQWESYAAMQHFGIALAFRCSPPIPHYRAYGLAACRFGATDATDEGSTSIHPLQCALSPLQAHSKQSTAIRNPKIVIQLMVASSLTVELSRFSALETNFGLRKGGFLAHRSA
jgi:hypothetical protein